MCTKHAQTTSSALFSIKLDFPLTSAELPLSLLSASWLECQKPENIVPIGWGRIGHGSVSPACSLPFVLVTLIPFIPIPITLNFCQLSHLQYLPGCMYDFRLEHIKLRMRMIKLTCSDKYGSVKVHGWLPSSLYFVEWVNSSNQAYILPLWYNSHCCEVYAHVLWPHHRHKYALLWGACMRMYSDLTTDTSIGAQQVYYEGVALYWKCIMQMLYRYVQWR